MLGRAELMANARSLRPGDTAQGAIERRLARGGNSRPNASQRCTHWSPPKRRVRHRSVAIAETISARQLRSNTCFAAPRDSRCCTYSRKPSPKNAFPTRIHSRFSNVQCAVVTRPSSIRSDSSMSRRKGAANRWRRKNRSRSCETSQVSRTSVPSATVSNS